MSSEEANARALLLEMQTRLAEGPHTALGLSQSATAQEIRSAFLQLTKTFHPARFGRMANDIQRLSNEVFLSLRAAHDALAKPKPAGRTSSTTGVPSTKKAGTRPFGVAITPTTQPGVPTTGKPATEAPTPPARQTGPIPVARSGHTPPPVLTRPGGVPHSGQSPPVRPSSPPPGVPVRPTPTPNMPTRPASRQSPPTGIKFVSPAAPRSGPALGAPAVQNPNPSSSSSAQSLDRELAPILELMGMGLWDVAQAAIDALAAKNPQNNRYAALACYARGRRAQLEGDRRSAQIELNEALKLDPDLEPAKIANAELFTRRK